ncbi:hypothetical protein DFH28DRAFT_1048319 [Melampsora americana]|nr:hypothetical protein DFH28DRAFT_1048319 [Melampsora americana]
MLSLRPNYLILLVVLLSVVGLSLACETPQPVALDKETKRFVDTLKAVHTNLNKLKEIKKDPKAVTLVLGVAAEGYCQLVTLNYSRTQIMKIVGKPFSTAMHIATEKPFKNMEKVFGDFSKKKPLDAVNGAERFANGMITSLKNIKRHTDKLSKAIGKKN